MTNKKLSHTPGTWDWYWKVNCDDGVRVADCGVIASPYTDMRNSTMVCRAPRYQTKDQWEADARLISAAPKLLFILEKIVSKGLDPFLDEAKQIIAEATGNTNRTTKLKQTRG